MLHFMYGVENSPSKEPAQESPNERPEEAPEEAPDEASEGSTPRELSHQPPSEPPQEPLGNNSGGQTKPSFEDLFLVPYKEQEQKLISHVWTNAIADYYNVPKLCNLANKEIALLFQTEWSPVKFLEAAKVVSSSTGDKDLHHLFAKLAVEHVEELLDYEDNFVGLMALDEFALQFMKGSADRMAESKVLVEHLF